MKTMTIKGMRALADKSWGSLSAKEKRHIQRCKKEQIGAFYGCMNYTRVSLWETIEGFILCDNYRDYCEIQSRRLFK